MNYLWSAGKPKDAAQAQGGVKNDSIADTPWEVLGIEEMDDSDDDFTILEVGPSAPACPREIKVEIEQLRKELKAWEERARQKAAIHQKELEFKDRQIDSREQKCVEIERGASKKAKDEAVVLANAQRKTTQLQKDLRRAEEELRTCRDQMRAADRVGEELAAAKRHLAARESALADSRNNEKKLQKEIQECQADIQDLKMQLVQTESKHLQAVEAQRGATDRKIVETGMLKESVVRMEEETQKIRTRLNEATALAREKSMENEQLKINTSELESQLARSKADAMSAHKQVQLAREQVAGLKKSKDEENRDFDTYKESTQLEIARLNSQADAERAKSLSAEQDKAETALAKQENGLLARENAQLKEKNEHLEVELDLLRKQMSGEAMGKQVEKLKKELEKKDKELRNVQIEVGNMTMGLGSLPEISSSTKQRTKAQKMIEKYPNRKPVKCFRSPGCTYMDLANGEKSKLKFAVPQEMDIQDFMKYMKGKLGLQDNQPLLLQIETPQGARITPQPSGKNVAGLYAEHHHPEDGCLHIFYTNA